MKRSRKIYAAIEPPVRGRRHHRVVTDGFCGEELFLVKFNARASSLKFTTGNPSCGAYIL